MKTVLTKLYKLMYLYNDLGWTKWVKDVETSENTRKRASLDGFCPLELVENRKKEDKLMRFYAKREINHKKKFGKKVWNPNKLEEINEGDMVRLVQKPKSIFDKIYSIRYSDKLYKVKKVRDTAPVSFLLENLPGRWLYKQEISKVLPIKDEVKKDLFIASTKRIRGRVLRSGKKSNEEILYLLKSLQKGGPGKYITEAEKRKLENQGLL